MSVKIRSKRGILFLDIHYGGGKRTRPTTGLEDTVENRKLLEKELIPDILLDIAKGIYVPKVEKIAAVKTVKEYGELSIKRHKNERRGHVQDKIINDFNNHIVKEFGHRLVSSITPMQLLDWQNEKMEMYAPTSVKKYRSILNMMFNDAVIDKIIDVNPLVNLKWPKCVAVLNEEDEVDEEDNNVDPFDLDELRDILSRASEKQKNFFGIMAFTGVRPGELVALKWSDVDLDNEIFDIKRTRIRGNFGPPKTKASRRKVEMLPGVKEYFMSQHKMTKGNEHDMVFLNSSQKPYYNHDTLSSQFRKLTQKSDERHLYQLRHTFASLMIANNEDIAWISKTMGHKNSDITLKVYTKAYKLIHDKNERKKRAIFLESWHKSGTTNNLMLNEPQEIGVV